MPTRLMIAGNAGHRIYVAGRVGLDTGPDDVGGPYTALMRTERFSPAGENALLHFRRVALRVWHTGSFAGTMRVYVDETQTQYYTSAGVLTDQELAFSADAPTLTPDETIVEMDINAQGTYIQVELEIESDAITGVFLPETIFVGARVLRPGRQRNASTT
jgi:hypothetical protein